MNQFFRLLVKASQPLKTSLAVNSGRDDCNEKKTRSSRSANASAKRRERGDEERY